MGKKKEKKIIELTQNQRNLIMACAKNIFDDCVGSVEYPFTDVSEQYDEIVKAVMERKFSWDFIKESAGLSGYPLN